jgi:hypothetical protein
MTIKAPPIPARTGRTLKWERIKTARRIEGNKNPNILGVDDAEVIGDDARKLGQFLGTSRVGKANAA